MPVRSYRTLQKFPVRIAARLSFWDKFLVSGATLTFLGTIAAAAMGYAANADQSSITLSIELCKQAYSTVQDDTLNSALTVPEQRDLVRSQLRLVARCDRMVP